MALLSIRDLQMHIDTPTGVVRAVDGVSLELQQGKTLALVGESGCGKSMTALSVMQLLPEPAARIVAGGVLFEGKDILDMSPVTVRQMRGSRLAMIFQEPMTSLNPTFNVGWQIREAISTHRRISARDMGQESLSLLREVEIREPEAVLRKYPHELSGGMRQRVMIAMALANRPSLLIADEPTTALDVTVQAQILRLLRRLQQEHEMAMLLITHDLGVVKEAADEVAVMYLGKVVESGPAPQVMAAPRHPYTRALFASRVSRRYRGQRLPTIAGHVPGPQEVPSGCPFHPRCRSAMDICRTEAPSFVDGVSCHDEV